MNNDLSNLPNMNSLLEHPLLSGIGRERVKYTARIVLDDIRDGFYGKALPSLDECARMILWDMDYDRRNLRGVINATGVVLHTNLGRAPLGADAVAAAAEACTGYCNLEYNLDAGQRRDRYVHLNSHICELTGAETAMVVNNNAAAMVLVLAALAKGKKVAVSRGELVEIGGSFRIPEIIAQSGAELIEVGTTNKTRLGDYKYAVENMGVEALLKVHTSNYEIIGFTESVPVETLARYGKSVGLPVIFDMGACFLIDPERYGFRHGVTAKSGIAAGADVVCFSGDKLAGSVQSGIVAGSYECVEKLREHPLARALRPDKLTLSVLESTLRLYRWSPDEVVARVPALAMLFASPESLRQRAEALAGRLGESLEGWGVEVRETSDEAGGGSLPAIALPGWAVALKPPGSMSANELESKLRRGRVPVIVRIHEDAVLVSVRTLMPTDEERVVEAIREAASGAG